MKKIIFLFLGFLFLGLGAIGAIVPILPTVPFLLVSAFCFGKSSEKVRLWFQNTKLYKNNLETYVKGEGMTAKTKIRVISMVTLLMGTGFFLMSNVPVGRIILSVIWIIHIIYFIFGVKTKASN